MIWGTLLFAVEPLRLGGLDLEGDDEEVALVLWVHLVETGVETTVVGAGCEELGLSQGMRFREEVVFDDVPDGGVHGVGDELDFAIEGADIDFVGLIGVWCAAGGGGVYGRGPGVASIDWRLGGALGVLPRSAGVYR